MQAKRVAVVAGATAGIGLAVTKGLAAAGYDLALIARNPDKAQALRAEIEEKNPRIGVKVYVANLARPGFIETGLPSFDS